MRNQIQRELDKAEEYILTVLFGDYKNPVLSKKIQLFLIAKGINFEDYINNKEIILELYKKVL